MLQPPCIEINRENAHAVNTGTREQSIETMNDTIVVNDSGTTRSTATSHIFSTEDFERDSCPSFGIALSGWNRPQTRDSYENKHGGQNELRRNRTFVWQQPQM